MKVQAVLCGLLVAGIAGSGAAGQSASTPADSQAPYTLQINSRVVLTDVTVTDKHGNPVTGLTRDDFRILDNGRPQRLASFEEHREQSAALEETAAERGVFSNDYLRHPPAQVNALLFDTTTIDIVDQMYLFEQMKKFVARLPRGQPVAVFTRWGNVTVQTASFTSNHQVLLAAIRKAIPRLRQPGAWMANDEDTLRQMALYLSQVPGRKNILWFTNGSNMYLYPDPLNGASIEDAAARRKTYDMLETERITIDPIGARGLTVSFNRMMALQQIQMREDAEATGGHAYLNTNGLALSADRILATDGDYYTLTYSPDDVRNNDKWHQVEVKLDRKHCQLSYRRGYYDDGSNGTPPTPAKARAMMRPDGSSVKVPNDRSEPIIFEAQVLPVSATSAPEPAAPPLKRGEQPYVVRYVVPAKDIYPVKVQGNVGTDVVGMAVLAFDQNGEPVARRLEQVTMTVDEEKERIPNSKLIFSQFVNLPKGQNYLYLAVWDTTTGRLGTVNAPVEVKKKK